MHSFSCALLILIILCGCDFPIVKENTALNQWIPHGRIQAGHLRGGGAHPLHPPPRSAPDTEHYITFYVY